MKVSKKAGDVMVRKMVKIHPEMTVRDAAVVLLKQRISSAPVVTRDGDHLGEFSQQSCMDALFHSAFEQGPDNHVRDYVKPWTQTLRLDDNLVTMVEKYHQTTQRILPVIHDEHIVGIVTRSQIIRTVLDYLKQVPDRKTRPIYLSALKKEEPPPDLLD